MLPSSLLFLGGVGGPFTAQTTGLSNRWTGRPEKPIGREVEACRSMRLGLVVLAALTVEGTQKVGMEMVQWLRRQTEDSMMLFV